MKKLITFIIIMAIPFLAAFIGSSFTDSGAVYSELMKPSFSPPSIVFPIVWSILYLLMGISSYIIFTSDASDEQKASAIKVYIVQLIVNAIWPIIFFSYEMYLLAYIIILLLILLVSIMIYRFFNINKIAGLLQLPYLLWICFASILNLSIFLLN